MIKLIYLIFILTLFLPACIKKHESKKVPCEVVKVYDGDTFKCKLENGKEIVVRLIGIDTPESKINKRAYIQAKKLGSVEEVLKLGEVAKEFTESILKTEKIVFLEFDAQKTDKYGRVLAYVWLSNGKLLNEILLQEGYAMLLTIPPNTKYVDRFKKAQKYAREEGKGLWTYIEVEEKEEKGFECGNKRYCREMSSCQEAMFYFRVCGLYYLDGDGDGIPCETLCRGF